VRWLCGVLEQLGNSWKRWGGRGGRAQAPDSKDDMSSRTFCTPVTFPLSCLPPVPRSPSPAP
jgi:hypothetical protein